MMDFPPEQLAKARAQFRVIDPDPSDAPTSIVDHEEDHEAAPPLDVEFPHDKSAREQLLIGSDAEIAQSVIAKISTAKGSLVFADDAFYTFNEIAWQELCETKIRRIIARWDGATYTPPGAKNPKQIQLSNGRIRSVLAIIIDSASKSGFFDDKAGGINCANGFLSFDHHGTPSLIPHSPEHKCRHTLKAKWISQPCDAIPEGSLLHKLMHGCFKGQENSQAMIDLIAEVIGVAAAGRIKQATSPKAVIFYGETAENGKSQCIKLAESLLPALSISHVAPSKMGHPEYAVKLAGKLLNTANELTAAAIESDAFKHAVTGEPLQCRDLYSSTVDLCCIAQHIFATNVLPSFRGGFDRGVRRRLLVIPFKRSIPADERVNDIGATTAKQEADLVLSWVVAGLSRFIKQGGYSNPQECDNALNNWVLAADPVAGWFSECVEFTGDSKDKIRTKVAWQHFEKWCHDTGLRGKVPALNGFSQRIKVVSAQAVTPVKKSEGMVFLRIRIRKEEPAEEPAAAG